MNFDDNALFRHKDIVEMRDLNEEDPLEVEASKFGLNYIKLDGSVGCMVNGAGLAMATMDIISWREASRRTSSTSAAAEPDAPEDRSERSPRPPRCGRRA